MIFGLLCGGGGNGCHRVSNGGVSDGEKDDASGRNDEALSTAATA